MMQANATIGTVTDNGGILLVLRSCNVHHGYLLAKILRDVITAGLITDFRLHFGNPALTREMFVFIFLLFQVLYAMMYVVCFYIWLFLYRRAYHIKQRVLIWNNFYTERSLVPGLAHRNKQTVRH
jgi:hypothetical protein